MNENNKNYYNQNQNKEQEVMLISREKNNSEDNEDDDNEIINKKDKKSIKKIGNNIIYKNKYILGISTDLNDMIFLSLYFFLIYIISFIYIFSFFNTEKLYLIYILIILSTTSSFLISLYCQIICFITEPGIIPRKYSSYKSNDYNEKIIYSKITKKPIIRIQKNCAICSIRRPKKCQHCFFCDNCVEEFDHHCKYVANCIGKRNKKFFYLFISFELIFLLQIYVISFFQLLISFRFNTDNIISLYNSIYLNIILIAIMLILNLANIFRTFDYKNYTKYGLYLSNILFIIFFYLNKSKELPKYISPFNIYILTTIFEWIYYFGVQFIHHIKMISFNMTSSQYRNLMTYLKVINMDESYLKLRGDNNNDDIDDYNMNDYSRCEIIKDVPSKKEIPRFNIKSFIMNLSILITKDIPPSLIYKEAIS